jgi:trehalose 6-phosphate phosphatase
MKAFLRMQPNHSGDGTNLPGLGSLVVHLQEADQPFALLLDFDGTLARICDRPGDARPEPAALAALIRLSASTPVAIVSGRGLCDLQTLIEIPQATFFGSHGQEARLPGGRVLRPFGESDAGLDSLGGRIAALSREYDGTWVEKKPQALVLHYRNLRDHDRLADLQRGVETLAGQSPQLSMMSGRKVFEFVPANAPGKGGAVAWHMDRLDPGGASGLLAVYMGDDVSDEGAFAAVATRGAGVLVAQRARPTAARYRLSGVNEVAAALTLLARAR